MGGGWGEGREDGGEGEGREGRMGRRMGGGKGGWGGGWGEGREDGGRVGGGKGGWGEGGGREGRRGGPLIASVSSHQCGLVVFAYCRCIFFP